MPLAHTPFRPRPEVDLLGTAPISVEEAARGLASALAGDGGGGGPEVRYELPGSTLVNFRQIPGIAVALQTDWVKLPGKEQLADCFVEVRGRLETHMHPCFLGEKLALGLRGAAGTMLLRFCRPLHCVPLGFKKLVPAGGHGAIVGESPYIHFLADFTAVGFVPKEGQWLIGRISEQQTALGVNILILNCFNMFVKRKNLPNAFQFDKETHTWFYGDKHHFLRSDRGPVWVQVQSSVLDTSGSVPTLFGRLVVDEATLEKWKKNDAAKAELEAAEEPAAKKAKKKDKEKEKEKEKDGQPGGSAKASASNSKAPAVKSAENDRGQKAPKDGGAKSRAAQPSAEAAGKGSTSASAQGTSEVDGAFRKAALRTGTLKKKRGGEEAPGS